MKLRLTSRRSADSRCAFCHGALDGAIASCPRCYTAFHRDCRAHLGKCTTLGCETTFARGPEVEGGRDAPLSLGWELLNERVGGAFVGLLLAGFLVLFLAHWPLPSLKHEDAIFAWCLLLLTGGACAWWLVWFAREALFAESLPLLMRLEPVRKTLEIHAKTREESRSFSAQLVATDGAVVTLDLDPIVGNPPTWLLALCPGTAVDVFDAGSGPVAIRTLDGHHYAVPASRVKRRPGAEAIAPRELPRLDEPPRAT